MDQKYLDKLIQELQKIETDKKQQQEKENNCYLDKTRITTIYNYTMN
jgi:N-acetylneuraminic acid mutarotase